MGERGFRHRSSVVTAGLVCDGSLLITLGHGERAYVWDLASGKLASDVVAPGGIDALGVQPGGNMIALAVGSDIAVYDVSTDAELWRTDAPASQAVSVVLSPDGTRMAAAGIDGTLVAWDLEAGAPLFEKRLATAPRALCLSPDGNLLGVGGVGGFQVIEVASGRPLGNGTEGRREARREVRGVVSLTFADAGHLAIGTLAPSVLIVRLADDELADHGIVGRLDGHRGGAMALAACPDERTLAVATGDGTVALWDLPSGRRRSTIRAHADAALSLAWSPNGMILVSGGVDRAAKLWLAASGARYLSPGGHDAVVHAVVVDPKGERAFSAGHDGSLRSWRLSDGKPGWTRGAGDSLAHDIAVSPDGRLLAAAWSDGRVRLLDVPSGVIAHYMRTGAAATAVTFAGRSLVSGSAAGVLALWSADTWQQTFEARLEGGAPIGSVAATDRGDIAAVTEDGWLSFGRPPERLQRLPLGDHGPYRLAAAPSGSRVAWCGVGGAGIVDVRSGAELARLTGAEVSTLSWSPDGELMALGGWDGRVRLWRPATGDISILAIHDQPVQAVAFAGPREVLAAGDDGAITTWELPDSAEASGSG